MHNIIRLSNPAEVRNLSKFSSAVVFNFKSTGQTFKKVDEEEEEEKSRPVKFSTSAGYNLNPHIGVMRAEKDDTPWFQGPVIALSLACFLIYFTMLRWENYIAATGQTTVIFITFREENDIDLQLSGRLYDKVDGLEKADVLNNIRYREEQGLDTTELKDRLKVLIELEEQKDNS